MMIISIFYLNSCQEVILYEELKKHDRLNEKEAIIYIRQIVKTI